MILGVTVLFCLSASVVWSETKLIPLNEYISKLDKPNGNQFIYTIHRAIVYRALEG
ncbi:MAG: hypothetical protein ACKVHI_06235 [Candidatus Puniceispirillales bacterium]